MTAPTLEQVAARLGKPAGSISTAYAAEVTAQANQCRTDPYTDDLAAALCRRVSRHQALAALPLGVQNFGDGLSVRVGFTDPEVRRLEAPYRKVIVG